MTSIKNIFGLLDKPPVKNNLAPLDFSETNLKNTLRNIEVLGIDPLSLYSVNKNHLRSDDFKKKHDGLHILFAGCSVTAGEGLPLDYTWSKIVYNKIKEESNVSGYYNIAQPGASPIDIVEQIITYTGEFGNPDIIFVNFPDIDREKNYHKGMDTSHEEMTRIATGMQIYGYYSRLVNICKMNRIKLIAFTWDDISKPTRNLDLRREFEGFGHFRKEDAERFLFNFKNSNPGHPLEEYFYVALDTNGSPEVGHPGVAYHSLYADLAYNMYRRIR